MIEWIKFKGSTEEERKEECIRGTTILVCDKDLNIDEAYISRRKCYLNKTATEMTVMDYVWWTPLNLPQEEKWERQEDFTNYSGEYNERMNAEFDNIYSILNELRNK